MSAFADFLRIAEGAGARRWYVVEDPGSVVAVLAGPFRTRREGRWEVARIAKERGEVAPWWPEQDTFPGFPGFSIQYTRERTYYVARASAMHDQGADFGRAIMEYEEAHNVC